jgi:serine/threonine-protein kinase HipA
MSAKSLSVFYENKKIGNIKKDDDERLSFSYLESWSNDPDSFSLSPQLLLGNKIFGHLVTRVYFENLLPEGAGRDRLNRLYRDITKDLFRYLQEFGEDCTGAITVSSDEYFYLKIKPKERIEIDKSLLAKAWHENKDLDIFLHQKYKAKFSLAGAQDKMAIIIEGDRWYVPSHGGATTHIVKPPIKKFGNGVDTVFNEFYCMTLAKKIGLGVPDVSIQFIDTVPFYIVERFDRINLNGEIKRIHQIDLCQTLNFPSDKKYEEYLGPTLQSLFITIKNNSLNPILDLERFIQWIFFNLIIGNNDSHAKNISLSLSSNKKYQLTPFYDLLSTVVYKGIDKKFAFSIGKDHESQSHWNRLTNVHFRELEKKLNLKKGALIRAKNKSIGKIEQAVKELEKNEQFNYRIYKKINNEIRKRIKYLREI